MLSPEILREPNFKELVRLSSRQCLTWSQLLELPLPHQLGMTQTWDVLQELHRCLGIEVPLRCIAELKPWYCKTAEFDEAMSLIQKECSEGSLIHQTISKSRGRHFLTEMRIDDIIATAELDGLLFDEESARNLLRYGHEPTSTEERLLANAAKIDLFLESNFRQPFSPELIREIYAIMSEGVDAGELKLLAGPSSATPERESVMGPDELDVLLAEVSSYANGTSGDRYDSPLARCFVLLGVAKHAKPFGVLSTQMAKALARLNALSSGYPVFSMLPISRARLMWERGKLPDSVEVCSPQSARATAEHAVRSGYLDLSLGMTVGVKLVVHEIVRLKNQIILWNERDKRLRSLLRDDVELNHRQRAVIARAMRSPESTFHIRYHQINHNIAYATARSDLMKLVEKGYLTMRMEGRAFVFRGSPQLKEKAPE